MQASHPIVLVSVKLMPALGVRTNLSSGEMPGGFLLTLPQDQKVTKILARGGHPNS